MWRLNSIRPSGGPRPFHGDSVEIILFGDLQRTMNRTPISEQHVCSQSMYGSDTVLYITNVQDNKRQEFCGERGSMRFGPQ